MSRSMISLLGAACLLGASPLIVQAAQPDIFSMPSPLGATLHHDGFSMQRIKAARQAGARTGKSALFGPEVLPKWQPKSGDAVIHRLGGSRFEFR